MATAFAELPASSLAEICATRPQISTRPLRSSEYYPPGISQTSKISTGVDANRIFNATVDQRSHIIQQLEKAEENARDALFALEMMEVELARETAVIKSTLSYLSKTLPRHEFEKMCDFAFGKSKRDWESVWKHEWIEDGKERDKFFIHRRSPSKTPQPSPQPSSPLPPSSPPLPSPPISSRNCLPPRTSPVRINRIPLNEYRWPTRPLSPLPPDGFRAPWGFVDTFGSTRYRPAPPEPVAGPSQPRQSRRLKRDTRHVEPRQDGTLVLVDPTEDIEAQRRQIKEKIMLQAQQRLPAEVQNSLRKIVDTSAMDRVQDLPVTWSRVFGDEELLPGELTNPFAQGDHIPPMYPDPKPREGDEEEEAESEVNSHVQSD